MELKVHPLESDLLSESQEGTKQAKLSKKDLETAQNKQKMVEIKNPGLDNDNEKSLRDQT